MVISEYDKNENIDYIVKLYVGNKDICREEEMAFDSDYEAAMFVSVLIKNGIRFELTYEYGEVIDMMNKEIQKQCHGNIQTEST